MLTRTVQSAGNETEGSQTLAQSGINLRLVVFRYIIQIVCIECYPRQAGTPPHVSGWALNFASTTTVSSRTHPRGPEVNDVLPACGQAAS